jgi:hypothetical protein
MNSIYRCTLLTKRLLKTSVLGRILAVSHKLMTQYLYSQEIGLLGWTGNSEISCSLLDGNISTDLHNDIKDLAPYLAMPDAVKFSPPIDNRITSTEFSSEWKKAENTLHPVSPVYTLATLKQVATMRYHLKLTEF